MRQVTSFPKYAAHDMVLTTSSADGKNTPISVPIPKGTDILIHVAGLHYNRECRPHRSFKKDI